MNPTRNITDLPMEVLYLIFENLPSVRERLRLAQTHPHLGMAFSCHYGQSFKVLNIRDMTVQEWSVLLPLCGSGVNHINSNNSLNDAISKLVVQHCPNVKSMFLKVATRNVNAIKLLLGKVRSVEKISLANTIEPTTGNYFGIVKLLKLQPNLKRLELWDFCGDEVLDARHLEALEDLEISYCSDSNVNIHELCHRLKKLRDLKIDCQGFSALTPFKGVPCPALRSLDLNCSEDRSSDSIRQHQGIPGLLKWILSHSETLEVLDLQLEISDFSIDTVVGKILSKCKYLSFLYMPVGSVRNTFATRLIQIVADNEMWSKERPLKLNFYNSYIHERVQEVIGESPVKEYLTFKTPNS